MHDTTALQKTLRDYYRKHGRHLPWREPEADGTFSPYKILVSECMLQQTQVQRVVPKYEALLKRFPTINALAGASLAEVVAMWSGLGYNRRAKYLHDAAKQLAAQTTWTMESLVACKGIGPNTAAAILAYAYNQPTVFIETNIRTVYIHTFFKDQTNVSDKAIEQLVRDSLDSKHPREFYWALMDYGTYLKQTEGNLSRHSKQYARQSTFEGSLRQLRGQILRTLLQKPHSVAQLTEELTDERLPVALESLQKDGLIVKNNHRYSVA